MFAARAIIVARPPFSVKQERFWDKENDACQWNRIATVEKLSAVHILATGLIVLWIFREMFARLQRATSTEPPPSQPLDRADVFAAATVAVAFYVLAIWRLGFPGVFVFDEVHHVRSAMEYINGLDPHEWTHPPLAKLIMATGMKLAGVHFDPRDNIWKSDMKFNGLACISWRFPAVIAGSLSLVAIFALARTMFENRSIAIAAATLLAMDGCFMVHARIGMTNIYTVCFILTATLGTWLYTKHNKGWWLLLTGFGLGLALATRWTSLWAWGFNGLVLIWHLVRQWRAALAEDKNPTPIVLRWIAQVGGAMVILPISLYILSYVPFVLQSTSKPGITIEQALFTSGEPKEYGPVNWSKALKDEPTAVGHGWYKVLAQQGDMWRYHTGIKDSHPYESPWWSWPLMLRPTWYHFEGKDGKTEGIWAIGNAFIWWGGIPALICALYLAWREKRPALGVVVLFGLGMWLCWGIKPRPLIFMHYLFEAIPFFCIALSYIGWRIWDSRDETSRFLVQMYAGLITFWFIFYFPLLTALGIPDWYFRMHLWLDNLWV